MIRETFFTLMVADMARATRFYVDALDAEITFASPGWTSLLLAGVRVTLAFAPGHTGVATGLHFRVDDLDAAVARVLSAGGGRAVLRQVGPGVRVHEVSDPDHNTFTFVAGD